CNDAAIHLTGSRTLYAERLTKKTKPQFFFNVKRTRLDVALSFGNGLPRYARKDAIRAHNNIVQSLDIQQSIYKKPELPFGHCEKCNDAAIHFFSWVLGARRYIQNPNTSLAKGILSFRFA
ncbi:MAG: hypothetical protein ACTMHT_06255, partial [Oceanisphaera sp.]